MKRSQSKTWAWLGRALSAMIFPFVVRYLRGSERTRVCVFDDTGKLLLVRNWLGGQAWTLPGGGLKRNEDVRKAAMREVLEETGVRLHIDDISTHGVHDRLSTYHRTPYRAVLCAAHVQTSTPLRAQWPEILHVAWFSPNELPLGCDPLVEYSLRHLGGVRKAS